MRVRRWWPAWAVAACVAATLVAPAGAAPKFGVTPSAVRRPALAGVRRPGRPLRSQSTDRVMVESSARRIDVNNLNMFVTNLGSWANDFANQNNSGLFFPKGTTKTVVYESGLWIGARVNGEPRATIAEYSQEYGPGAMIGAAPDDASLPAYQVYKVSRWTGSASDTDHVERSAAAVAADRTLDPIVHHSWSEYIAGAKPYGAPTRIYRLPNPDSPGDSVAVEGPDVTGDQMLWAVYNDADPARHANTAGSSAPLGLEVQQTTFAFDRQGPLGNTLFLKFKIINKGGQHLDSMFVSLWADPDLGGATDDLVGCDVPKSLGFCYNATNADQYYGVNPPALGYDFFQGPKQGGVTQGLASFDFYSNGKDPQNAEQTYNLMTGLNADGTPVINPLTGLPSAYYASGDPVAGTGWLDGNAADRRFLMSAGPFSMAPGDTQIVVGAIIVAQGADRLSSVTGLEFYDVKAQKAFDVDFQLPPPPPQPKVTAGTDHGTVTLVWDAGSWQNYHPDPGYAFEGYVVYQGASISGPWKRLKVLDLVDGIKDVRDSVLDVTTGMVVHDSPVAFGGDNGLAYVYTATQDAIRGGALKDGQRYFFAVTAYAVNLSPPPGFDKVLEDSYQPVVVVVQRPPQGTDLSAVGASLSTDHRVSSEAVASTDHVAIDIVNPVYVTDHTYAVTYSAELGARRPHVSTTPWNLVDVTTGQMKLSNVTERDVAEFHEPVDGMVIRLREQQQQVLLNGDGSTYRTAGPLNDVMYSPQRVSNPFHGVGAGLVTFEDSFGYAWDFFNGHDPMADSALFPNVELRFGPTQKAYRYFRDELPKTGGVPGDGSRGYGYGGFHDIAFQAWDVDHNVQLEVGFIERRITNDEHQPVGAQPATQDATWMPSTDPVDGGREYLSISSRPYTGHEGEALAVDGAFGGDDQWLYSSWLYRTALPRAGDKFFIGVGGNVVGTANDSLVFTAHGMLRNQEALQRAGLDRIRVVPNPYYTRSSYELSSLNRVIKFLNLPETATIRIYNLAGDLVRTLRKTDATSSVLEWDLLTENRLPVASGVYVYHVDVRGVGQTTGKLIVFMEKERLSNF